MNTRLIIIVAALFATFVPMFAQAQKPPTGAAAQPAFIVIAAPEPQPTLVPEPAPASPTSFAPVAVVPQVVYATPTYATQASTYAPNEATSAPATTQPSPQPAAPSAPQASSAAERGNFRFSIDGGFSVAHVPDQEGSWESAQLNAFFGWTLTNGAPRSDGRRPVGVDLGFALRLDVDDTALVSRPQLTMRLAFPYGFATLGLGVASLQVFEGGDPVFGASLDATIGWRVGGAFYLGATSGMDAWNDGPTVRRVGLVLGFAMD